MNRYKGLCLILDGLGDNPHPELQQQTPLQAANTPHLDKLLQQGQAAMVSPLLSGVPVGTHTGTAVLFGIAPQQVSQISRGPIEAAGIGLSLTPGDVALRCNFATIKAHENQAGFTIVNRRAGRIDAEVVELSQVLRDIKLKHGVIANVYPATQHRGIVHLRGKKLSADISDTDAGTANMAQGVLLAKALHKKNKAAKRTAKALNQLIIEVHQRLAQHPLNQKRIAKGLFPANAIITRGAGQAFAIDSVLNYLNLKTAVISGESTVSGLARLFNYTCIEDVRFTALSNTDLKAKVNASLQALEHHDLVYLHVKATDIYSHDCDPVGKKDFIERIDRELAPLWQQKNTVFAVVSDHSTNSHTGRHSGAPVPAILTAPHHRHDSCQHYNEIECQMAGLGHINSTAFLMNMLDTMGHLRQFTQEMNRFIF